MVTKDISSLFGRFNRSDKSKLLTVTWDLTYRCQNKCVHCFEMNVHKKKQEEVTLSQIGEALGQIRQQGAINMIYSGGDPFVREDFMDILEETRRQGFSIAILSSGQAINPEITQNLKNVKVMRVELTFLGCNSETHDALSSIVGSYSRLMRAIECLQENDVKIKAKYMLLKQNVDEVAEFIAFCKSKCIEYAIDYALFEPWNKTGIVDEYLVSKEDMCKYYCQVGNVIPHNPSISMCSAGFSSCAITPYGDVVPCNTYGNAIVFGNIKTQSFGEIFEGEKAVEFRKKYPQSKIVYEKCGKCNDSEFCDLCFGFTYQREEIGFDHICRLARIKHNIYEEKQNENSSSL